MNTLSLRPDSPAPKPPVYDADWRCVLPGVIVSRLGSPAPAVLQAHNRAQATPAPLVLVVLEAGTATVYQDGRVAPLRAGDYALCDAQRPYHVQFDAGFQAHVLSTERSHLSAALAHHAGLTATTVPRERGAARVLCAVLQALVEHATSLHAASLAAIADALVKLAAAGFEPAGDSCRGPLSSLASYHLRRLKQTVDDALKEPGLSVRTIGARVGLSERQVQRLFAQEGLAPSRYIWRRRLEACSRDLLDPSRSRHSIGQIAQAWGFTANAHFSRAFRHHFGCSPRTWRRQATTFTGAL